MARTQVLGKRALEAKLRDLLVIADVKSKTAAAGLVAEIVDDAAKLVRDTARSNAAVQSLPNRVVNSIFKFGDTQANNNNIRGALAGVRTGAPPRLDANIFIRWRAGAKSFNPRAKAAKGTLIGSSLAALYERGFYDKSGKLTHRPFFRRAVISTRSIVRTRIIAGYKNVIESFNR